MTERHTKRILVIEDDEGYQELLNFALSKLADVVVCTTLEDGKRKIQAERFDLIILDINLKDKSGLEILLQLQVSGRLKECPVLLCSGQKDANTKRMARNMGAAGFIEKPFLSDALQNDVRALFRDAASGSGRPRALVIEDDEGYQELLTFALSSLADVVVCTTLEDGKRKIQEERFDLIILDINLHDKSGLEILMQLQVSGRVKECPVLLCSAQTDADTKRLAQNMGAAGFIEKPFLSDALQNEVRSLLGRSG